MPVGIYTTNLLLNALSPDDLELLKPAFERVELEREQVLSAASELITDVFFLEGGIASIVSTRIDSGRTEVGIFGREGVSGTAALMGVDRSPHETFMQVTARPRYASRPGDLSTRWKRAGR